MRKWMVFFISLSVLLIPVLSIVGPQLHWGVQEGAMISYNWEYEGDPSPESQYDYNFTFEGIFDIVILETELLESYNDYNSIASSISYRIEIIETDDWVYYVPLYYLHPLPIGNWSHVQTVYSSVFPNVTYADSTTHMTANFTLGLPYSNFPKCFQYQYSKTDGVVDNVIEKWYNNTSEERFFYSEITRINHNNTGVFIIIGFGGSVAIIAVLVIVMKNHRK